MKARRWVRNFMLEVRIQEMAAQVVRKSKHLCVQIEGLLVSVENLTIGGVTQKSDEKGAN